MFLNYKSDFHKNSHIKHKDNIKGKSWYFFKWEFLLILGATFIIALLNFIPNLFEDNNAVDDMSKYYLRNDIVYSTISIFLTIGVAIFIGVFTEMGQYVGKYGSAIFVLVPALLWLFSERGHGAEGMERVVSAANEASSVVFWVTVGFGVAFVVIVIFYSLVIPNILDPKRKERMEYIQNFLYRLMLLVINILIVLLMSYALINYALFTLHLGDLNAAEKAEYLKVNGHAPYPVTFHNDRIVIYHSVVTAFFAILMVLIGMTNFIKESKNKINSQKEIKEKAEEKEKNIADNMLFHPKVIENDHSPQRPVNIAIDAEHSGGSIPFENYVEEKEGDKNV